MSQRLTPAQLYGRIGGLRLRATHDPHEYTAAGRRAFLGRFEREVDPDGHLPPAERAARAEAARKAYMASLAAKSAAVRRQARRSDADEVAALKRRLAALEARVGANPVASTLDLNIDMHEMDPAAVAMPAGSQSEVRCDRTNPAA